MAGAAVGGAVSGALAGPLPAVAALQKISKLKGMAIFYDGLLKCYVLTAVETVFWWYATFGKHCHHSL